MKKYLLKVRYALSGLRVYEVETDNIYRIIGKMVCTSMEHIERIDYSRFTLERLQYWIDEGFKINKYKEPVLSEDERAMVFKLSEEQINEVKEDVLKSVDYNERKIKAEAIKEFAESLKNSIYINTNLLVYQCEAVESMIDDVVKEMVGETNDT